MNKIRIITALPLFLLTVAIFIASSRPGIEYIDFGIWETDKLVHIAAFFVYGCFIIFFLLGNFRLSKKRIFILTLVIGLLFAASDEYHQSFVPGRVCDIYDFIADAIGLFLSQIFVKKIENFVLMIKKRYK